MRALVIATLFVASNANADEAEDPPPPRPTFVHGKLEGAAVHLSARYVIPIAGPAYTPSVATLAYPIHGVVTAATATVAGVAHRLQLTRAGAAASAFDGLTQLPESPGKQAWSLNLSNESGTLSLDVAVPRSTIIALDLDVTVPTCFYRDARYVLVPGTWWSLFEPGLRSPDAKELEISEACTDPGSSTDSDGAWLRFDSNELSQRPPGDARIDGIAMRLPLGARQGGAPRTLANGDVHLARVELDLAREISAAPADLHTAIVVDNSRSLTDREAKTQRLTVASYLQHAPQSFTQVIAYAHTARALLPSWTNAHQAAPRIDRILSTLGPRNGSDLDLGLVEAGKWLGRVSGTKRVVLFTDERLSQRLLDSSAVTLRRLLPPNTVVQIVALAEDEGVFERTDDALLSDLADATEGMSVVGRLDAKQAVDATMLVRPISLDHVTVDAPGWTALAIDGSPRCGLAGPPSLPNSSPALPALLEGSSCTWVGEGTASSGPITIGGLLWGRPFRRMLRPDDTQALALARILTATSGLDEPLRRSVDELAKVVNSVWSMTATWGGEAGYGLQALSFHTSGFSSSCDSGGNPDVGLGRVGGFVIKLDVEKQFREAADTCHPGDAKIELEIETTLQEIVDVRVTVDSLGQTADSLGTLHDCIEAAIWEVPAAIPNASGHDTRKLVF